METKASLNAQLAAAKKKHGAKSQAAGRIQYKLNQLNKDSKGTAVKTKTGVLRSKTGVVRQTDATKKKRTVTKRKTPSAKQPNNPFKTVVSAAPAPAKIKGSPIKKKIAANSGSKVTTKKITTNSGSKVTPNSGSKTFKPTNQVVVANLSAAAKKQADQKKIQAENNKKIKAHQAKLAKQKADKKEAKRQNDAIDSMASKSDKEMRARKKTAARLAGQKQNEKNWNATRKLSTDEKVKQRQKDYRNNKTSPY